MAKLNKSEINAIAEQIQKDLKLGKQESIKAKNEQLKEAFYQTEVGQKVKFLQDNPETNSLIYDHALNNLIGLKYYSGISIYDIARRLIIEQIECDNIEDLISKVTEHFKTEE